MTSLHPADQVREAVESRRRCEEIVGRRVSAFAYPYGDLDQSTASAVRRAGLAYGCSTVERAVGVSTDLFAIPRLLAADWNEAEFRRRVLA
jgi:peptidoglycan/xylan/chitin deacetylase (PgdA/CDA1 family)